MHNKLQNMHHNLIQLAITFSLLSVVFLHSPMIHFFHSFISHFSTFSSQLFSLATDKNYIFLLCNGILVFIAKYSGKSVDTSPPEVPETNHDDNELISEAYRKSMQSTLIENSVIAEDVSNNEGEYENELQANAVMPKDYVEDKYVVYQITDGTVTEQVISEDENNKNDDDDDDGDGDEYPEKEFNGWSYEEKVEEKNKYYKGVEEEMVEVEDEDEEEEEAIAKMSTEELNRKFDDFIRKMKEELRIEAQRQLIVV